MNKPQISVVMSVYNTESYLHTAIQSILNQTYKNFEFIIIDDGSTDKSLDIIKEHQLNDKRIKIISRENRGLIASLNEGIAQAQGKYIARMDADDISLPNRFQMQIECLETKNIDICGGWMEVFNENKIHYIEQYPEKDIEIKVGFFFKNTIGHPTVMFKKEIVKEYLFYSDIEDYATWVHLSNKVLFYNIPKVVLKYRKHVNNTCSRNNLQKESFEKLVKDMVAKNKFILKIPSEHVSVFFCDDRKFTSENIENLENFYIKIISLSRIHKNYFILLKNMIIIKLLKIYIKNIFKVRFVNLNNFFKIFAM